MFPLFVVLPDNEKLDVRDVISYKETGCWGTVTQKETGRRGSCQPTNFRIMYINGLKLQKSSMKEY